MHQDKKYFEKIGARGQLIVISGPSGVGKRTLVKEYLSQHPVAIKVPTVTTRPPRDDEEDGEQHYFISQEDFDRMIRNGEIIDYSYYNRYGYGTTVTAIENARNAGRNVILIENVTGSMRVKSRFPDASLIFILPMEWDELEERIQERFAHDPQRVEDSLHHAKEQILCASQFDYVLVNDTIEKTVRRLGQIIHGNRYAGRNMVYFLDNYIQSEIQSDLVDVLTSINR